MAKGKRQRRLKNKSEDYEQKHCNSCDQPINQNCFNSDKMTGLCGKCYRTDLRECDRRKLTKKQVKTRKQERKVKTHLMSY
jgi:hypothetical protein